MRRLMRISDQPVAPAGQQRLLKWDQDRNYSSDADIAKVVGTGRNCLECRHCMDSGGIVYVSGETRYSHLCNYEPNADLHFVWDRFVCRAFEWLDGRAPRANQGNRKIKL